MRLEIHSLRRLYYLFVIFMCLSLFTQVGFGQESFPDSWCGKWEGTLEIYNPNGKAQEVPMSLEIQAAMDSTYSWEIHYGIASDTTGTRGYSLIPVDKEKNSWLIDENNGIEINSYFIGNQLLSVYDVMGNSFFVSYQHKDKAIEFNIIVKSNSKAVISGDTIIQNQKIPEVKSYFIPTTQKAILHQVTE